MKFSSLRKWAESHLFLMGVFLTLLPIMGLLFLFVLPASISNEELEKRGNYKVTPPDPHEVGDHLTSTITYTIDAGSKEKIAYFDFSRGSVVTDIDESRPDLNWDLGFERVNIFVNKEGEAKAGVIELDKVDFDSVESAPEEGYKPILINWYNYEYFPPRLFPKDKVYIVRTADNKYAKMKLLSYFCEAKRLGCFTIQYVYQGNGSRSFKE